MPLPPGVSAEDFSAAIEAFKAAVETMLAWHPERILLAHGRWYANNAEAELRRACRWVL